jgi:hypothetical protein
VTHAIHVHVRPIQTCLALLFLTATVFAGGPLGCDLLLKPPEIPEMKAPEAPDVQAPEGPEGPKVETEGGVCCLRRSEAVAKGCSLGADRCCNVKYDREECEGADGLWYESWKDCKVMC